MTSVTILNQEISGNSDQIHTDNEINYEELFTNRIPDQIVSLIRGLQYFRLKRLFTDVILCVSEEEFACHKVVLAASSRYFEAMFRTPCREQQTSRVCLESISPWAVKHLIDFSYTGYLNLRPHSVQDVFVAASLLDYPNAVRACVRFMEQHLDITNCLGVQLLADVYEFKTLAEAAKKMAIENFTRLLAESREWTSMPISSVVSYLSSDDLDVRSEEVVLNACISWIVTDPEARLPYFVSLLRLVRLHYIPTPILEEALKSTIFKDCPGAAAYLESVLKMGYFGGQQIDRHSARRGISSNEATESAIALPAPRTSTFRRETLLVLGGINTNIIDSMEALSPLKSLWLPCAPLPIDSLTWFSAVVAKNILIVTGGIRAGSLSSSVYRYSVEENKWVTGADMLRPRARHASVTVSPSHVLLFGGLTILPAHEEGSPNSSSTLSEVPTLSLLKTIDKYDLEMDTWTTVGYTDRPRQGSSVAVVTSDKEAVPGRNCTPTRVEDSRHELLAGVQDSSTPITDSHECTVVELGGVLDITETEITDRMAIYHVGSDLSVLASEDYIKLTRPVRYVKCAVKPLSRLIYIFWEDSSELSVLDIHRPSIWRLSPITRPTTDSTADNQSRGSNLRVHCGLAWIGSQLYVLGGFSRFVGANSQPVAARDDVYRYDPEKDKWSRVCVGNTTTGRALSGCVCLEM